MFNVVQADISNVAPELAGETSGRVTSFITAARLSVSEDAWGTDKGTQAVIYLTCHLLTMANRGQKAGAAGGSVSQIKVGDLEQQFRQNAVGEVEDLEATSYGMMFLGLRRTIVKSPLVL